MRCATALLMLFVIGCTEDSPTSGSDAPASKAPPSAKAPQEKADAADEKRPADDVARLCRIAGEVVGDPKIAADRQALETMKRFEQSKPGLQVAERLGKVATIDPADRQAHMRTMLADLGGKDLECEALLDMFEPRPPETATAVVDPPPPEEPTDPRSTLTSDESLGDLKLGITAAELGKLLPGGKTKGKREEEGATGEFVQTFVDDKNGVEVLLSSTTATGPQTVRAITVRAPSTRTTKRGIGIGASAEDVKKAYADVLDPEFPPDAESIIAGSVYDGVIFSLEAGKVRSIFMGPGAE